VPLVGSKAGQVFNSGEPLVLGAVAADADHFKGVDRDTGKATESLLCLPLDAGGKRLGVVQLRNKRGGDYSVRDVVLIQHFASQAAKSLRNAQLFEDLLAHMGLFAADLRDPARLIEELTRPPRSEQVSVLFADMRGFTQLCQIVPGPERALVYLNEFLALLSDAVIAEDGIVNKFLGDGLMALFKGEAYAARAVRAGHAMTLAFLELRDAWNARSAAPLGFLDLGVGIATETVIIGSIGGHGIRDYTAVGTAVNLAAHLMECARDGRRILVDKLTYHAARDGIGEADGPELFHRPYESGGPAREPEFPRVRLHRR
jgi:class 3 adenylate cyclase